MDERNFFFVSVIQYVMFMFWLLVAIQRSVDADYRLSSHTCIGKNWLFRPLSCFKVVPQNYLIFKNLHRSRMTTSIFGPPSDCR